jgi:phage N-6-adenine-methyltransferase
MIEDRGRLAVMMSSANHDWETPALLFAELELEFGPFDLDPCCLPETAKCVRYFTPADDGLRQPWSGRVFCNPPYGREIGKWVRKAWEESRRGATVVLLIPARTDTSYWHDYCFKGEVRFLRGRIYFSRNGRTGRAPFPSAVVVFRGSEAA